MNSTVLWPGYESADFKTFSFGMSPVDWLSEAYFKHANELELFFNSCPEGEQASARAAFAEDVALSAWQRLAEDQHHFFGGICDLMKSSDHVPNQELPPFQKIMPEYRRVRRSVRDFCQVLEASFATVELPLQRWEKAVQAVGLGTARHGGVGSIHRSPATPMRLVRP
jgi:hypothetical protein